MNYIFTPIFVTSTFKTNQHFLLTVLGERRGELHRAVADRHVDAPRDPAVDDPAEVGVLRGVRGGAAAAGVALLRLRRLRPQEGAPLHVRRVLRRTQVGAYLKQL